MVPAISFAYENPELDIMERQPRTKRDYLVNTKLISFAYFQIGVIQASAGMYTYFLIMNDFGIRPSAIWGLSAIKAPAPRDTDVYDMFETTATKRNITIDGVTKEVTSLYGNTMILDESRDKSQDFLLLWDTAKHSKIDVRLFYAAERGPEAWTSCRWAPDGDAPSFYRESHVSEGHPICYSSEANKVAQSGYLVSIVCVQWADLMICKTRNLSLSQQGMVNQFGNFGLVFETVLVAILLYVPFLNIALTTRQIPFPHFAVPSFSFYVAIFFYDEVRKIWLRSGMVKEGNKLRFKGWVVQNTYY